MTNVNVCVFEMHLTFRLDPNSDSSWGSILSFRGYVQSKDAKKGNKNPGTGACIKAQRLHL